MTDPSARAGDRVLSGRYVLMDRLGAGGAGVVWRARDRVLDRVVALKLLHTEVARDPGATARFRAEATAAARLTHPHAVIVYDIGRDHDRDHDYLVMELVDGVTLADVVDGGPLAPGVVAALGSQVAAALGAAHARGLVHRDVKPANVMVTREGIAKVTDFGIARALGEATSRLTVPGYVMGTARYLAPEQLRDQDVDGRADVYALGLVLHQALTGRVPFGDGTAVEVAMRRLTASLSRPSDHRAQIPPELDDAIARATRLDPDERFEDGGAFAAALARLAGPHAAAALATRVEEASSRAPGAAGPAPAGAGEPAPGAGEPAPGAGPPAPAPTGDAQTGTTHALDAPSATTDLLAGPTDLPSTTDPAGLRRDAAGLRDGDRPATDGGDSGPPGAGTPADAGTVAATRRGRRRRPVGAVVAAALVVAVGVVLATDLLDRGGGEEPEDEPADEEVESESDPVALEVVDGRDHDPHGSGEEHRADVPNAFDGDPTTAWQTQRYRGNPELGGLKPGVGLWFDLGERHTVAEVVVTTTNPGASFTLYAGDAPPDPGDDPDDWGTEVARVGDAGEEARIELEPPAEGRAWLLWFTALPADGGEFRATVSDVQFLAP